MSYGKTWKSKTEKKKIMKAKYDMGDNRVACFIMVPYCLVANPQTTKRAPSSSEICDTIINLWEGVGHSRHRHIDKFLGGSDTVDTHHRPQC